MVYARAITDAQGALRFQALEDHLEGVASRAQRFAAAFGGEAWGELAGRWHDLGKYAADFQRYLLEANGVEVDHEDAGIGDSGRVDHSAAGALHALRHLGQLGVLIAHPIAAHHAGLYDASELEARLERARTAGRLEAAKLGAPPPHVLDSTALAPPTIPGAHAKEPLAFATWLRLLFSCLVDADVLDSEAFGDPAASRLRSAYPALAELKPRFDAHMARFKADSPVKQLRAQILADCRERAACAPGLFSLTVPTGGGKTLSSMAFALEHAQCHGFKRMIYVIPYTSIIEQTADVFRGIFGDSVVEHHSNFEVQNEGSRETQRSRLATENWDAPIIVTTNVQFFESLFAARTSRCRKLHNILDSVVILDEAQMLPPPFLLPITNVLRLLGQHYRTSIVLCTATQPALSERRSFGQHFRGLPEPTELVADREALYRQLKRVRVELPEDLSRGTDWPDLAERVSAHDCVLVIVNSRADAQALHAVLPTGSLHLSGRMCGAHRSEVIQQIRQRLEARREGHATAPLRVVSTSLIEAGVDVDFPVVYRALAGLDSIAQAAGRCNREGLLAELGRVIVFVPMKPAPPGLQRMGAQACIGVLKQAEGDPLQPALFTRYFQSLYSDCALDQHDIVGLLKAQNLQLRTAAERFKLIDDGQQAILVPYQSDADDGRYAAARAALMAQQGQGAALRRLQRFTVNVNPRDFQHLQHSHEVHELFPGVWELVSPTQYDAVLGLRLDGPDAGALLMV
ncbi:MAG: CRISPR-associated helicase Cas3' [Xanthomonadales bacterium]|nr:CRISPR-associated helicase Cas3' [Xanthomonadales bacterium]